MLDDGEGESERERKREKGESGGSGGSREEEGGPVTRFPLLRRRSMGFMSLVELSAMRPPDYIANLITAGSTSLASLP